MRSPTTPLIKKFIFPFACFLGPRQQCLQRGIRKSSRTPKTNLKWTCFPNLIKSRFVTQSYDIEWRPFVRRPRHFSVFLFLFLLWGFFSWVYVLTPSEAAASTRWCRHLTQIWTTLRPKKPALKQASAKAGGRKRRP